MTKSDPSQEIARKSYAALAKSPLHSLVFVLPFLAFYHVGCLWAGGDSDLLAPRYLAEIFRFFGATAPFLPPLAIVAVLLAQHFARGDKLRLHGGVLWCVFIETVLWTLPMIAMAHLIGRHMPGELSALAAQADGALLDDILAAVGAGIYEEFIFRLLLIGFIVLFFADLLSLPRSAVYPMAVITASIVFGLFHPQGKEFIWGVFLFYTIAGAYLGTLFLLRGFAIVVGAHAFFNVYYVLIFERAAATATETPAL